MEMEFRIGENGTVGDTIVLPEGVSEISSYQPWPQVRKLVLRRATWSIKIEKTMLPNLEDIEFEGMSGDTRFDTETKSLIQRGDLIATWTRSSDPYVLGDDITHISDFAFAGTNFREIVTNRKSVRLSSNAFEGSEWKRVRHDNGYEVFAGNLILFDGIKHIENMVIDQKINEVRLPEHVYSSSLQVDALQVNSLHDIKVFEDAWVFQDLAAHIFLPFFFVFYLY